MDRAQPGALLPAALREAYDGDLQFPQAARHSVYVVANFVTTLDGVVSYQIPGKSGGGEISGFNDQDRYIMALPSMVMPAISASPSSSARPRFEDVSRGVDAVIDLVGGEMQARSFAVLKPGGILVSTVSQPDQEAAARHGVRVSFFLVNVTTAQLTRIAGMIDAGELIPRVGAVLALADARTAHEMLEGARPRPGGKIVLRVGD